MPLSLKNVSFRYTSDSVLSNASLKISDGDKIALVGPNGSGKSTILRILSGELNPQNGRLQFEEWDNIQHVPQIFNGEGNQSGLEYGDSGVKESLKTLQTVLGLTSEQAMHILDSQCGDLSGGQKKCLMLMRAMLHEPSYLLIDEPENDLDIVIRERLFNYLKSYWGAVVMVSHDQYFLEMAEKIVGIEEQQTILHSGTYSEFIEKRDKLRVVRQREYNVAQKEIQRVTDSLPLLKRKAEKSPSGSGVYNSRQKLLEKLKNEAPDKPENTPEVTFSNVDPKRKTGKKIVSIEGGSFGYDGNVLVSGIDLDIRFGEKVVIIGKNGAGKSTLIKTILNGEGLIEGKFQLGVNMSVGYFSQSQNELPEEKDLGGYVQEQLKCDLSAMYSFLRSIAIPKYLVSSQLKTLSGGQKARLVFGIMFSRKPDVLILDEPTNKLDPDTWGILSDHVRNYNGTVITITHDRRFAEKCGDRFLVLDGGYLYEADYLHDGVEVLCGD